MDKVFIVTTGVYSDYKIRAVFDDENMADNFTMMFRDEDVCVEEYTLNEYSDTVKKGYKPYSVNMKCNGDVERVQLCDVEDAGNWGCGAGILYNYCLAKNENHAIKVTNELRVRLIAENQL